MKQAKQLLIAMLIISLFLSVGMIRTEAAEIDGYPLIEPDTAVTVNIENGGDVAYFRFVPEYTESYTFSSTGNGDTFGHLYDSEMTQLKSNDDDGEGSNFSITYTLEAGQTYVFAARFYGSGKTGSFKVLLQVKHSYKQEVTRSATCTEDGVMGFTCITCGQEYTKVIPASHTLAESGTECALCGEGYVASGFCGQSGDTKWDIKWVIYKDGSMVISGYGHMTSRPTWSDHRDVITHAVIHEGVNSIGADAFYNCSNLSSISLPESLTDIYSGAFYGCSALTEIAIPDGLTSIGDNTFSGCSSLASIDIPDSITSIYSGAFEGCSNLTNIDLPDNLTYIGGYALQNCSSLTSIDLPDNLTYIGGYALQNCSSLTSIDLPDGITTIIDCTFFGCSSLTSIDIPDGVTSIGDYAFSGCSSLISIDIPEGITSIDYSVFRGCSSLTGIEIPDGVTIIDACAFENCSSLTSIGLPDSITSIYSGAFCGCSSLTDIDIPDGVTSIGASTFRDCTSLVSIDLPNSLTYIGQYAFSNCSKLTSIDFPDGIAEIDHYAFLNCTSLTTITFSGDAPYIIWSAFDGVTATIFYPAGNDTWTEDIWTNRVGNLIWVPYYNVFEDGTDTEIEPGEEAVIHIDADHTKLMNVYMDGELVDPANYTVTEGSTIITFKTSYLARLPGGEHEVSVEFEGGAVAMATITTTGPAYTPGDINGDGNVNNRDAARLMQYLAGWDIECEEAALDVNGDGNINNRDAARLMQYLAGWDVEIF